jgi:adenosine deaminase
MDSIADTPIREFLDRGVRFSINSDDPAYFGSYIQENYCAVQEAFDLSVSDWGQIALNAVEGSWCSDARKQVLREQVAVVISRWQAAQDT